MAKAKHKKAKHVPLRTCIGTGQKLPKKELIRFVVDTKGKVVIDKTGKQSGRGANLSMSEDAFDGAVKKKAFVRALKLESQMSEAQVSSLKKEFLDIINEKKFRPDNKPVTIKITKEELEKARSRK